MRRLARTAAALWSSRPGLSTSFSTWDTLGAFLLSIFDREMMYLWRVWYSLAEMVYLSAFLKTGSVVDFAVSLSRGGLGLS
jgi:hypothetical protein